jgi:tetratricopeptide (TPR) repeat protein
MRTNKTLPIVALTLSCAWQAASAQQSAATQRCAEMLQTKVTEETAQVCAEAAKESRAGRLMYGLVLAMQGDSRGAIEYYSKVLAGIDVARTSEPVTVAALGARASAYYLTRQDDLAFKDATAYLKHQPDDADILFIAASTAPSAEIGLSYAEKALTLNPDNFDLLAVHARRLAKTGKRREALAAVEKAGKLAPSKARALTEKGMVHSYLGEYARAEKFFAQALQEDPSDTFIKTKRADALRDLRRHKEAIAVASEALQVEPDNTEALYIRASSQLDMGDGEAALADIERLKQLAPNWDASEDEARAQKTALAHRMFTSSGLPQLEADRNTVMRAFRGHLRSKCGNLRLPEFSLDLDIDQLNADLDRYRDCLTDWYKLPELAVTDTLTPGENEAFERLIDASISFEQAEMLRCSKMPKGSKCINDAIVAKARPIVDGIDNPIELVTQTEANRLSSEVAALNKGINRHNRNVAIADFLHDLAEALNE